MTMITTPTHFIGAVITSGASHATVVHLIDEENGLYEWRCVCGVEGEEPTYYRRASMDAQRHRNSEKQHFFARPLSPLYRRVLLDEEDKEEEEQE